MKSLKERLRAIRGRRTQASFSSEIGIPLTTLGRYERGDNPPDINHIISICNKYNISTDWLLLGKGSMHLTEPMRIVEKAPEQSGNIAETIACTRCIEMDVKINKIEHQRDELMLEIRQWATKMEQLLRENGDLRERCARLEERQACCNVE